MPIVGQPSNRSLVPLENSNRAARDKARAFQNSTQVSGQNAPIGDDASVPSGRLSQQQNNYPAFLGVGVAAGLWHWYWCCGGCFKPVGTAGQRAVTKMRAALLLWHLFHRFASGAQFLVGHHGDFDSTDRRNRCSQSMKSTIKAACSGDRLTPVRVDGRSDNATFALETERLIKQNM